jgi:tetratricopeptide (TPR) repeat protein
MSLREEVEGLLKDGARAEAEGNAREAALRYEAALKAAPDNVRPHLLLGTLAHRSRDYERARALLEEAARLDPENPDVVFRLGLVCDAEGDVAEAQNCYRRAASLAPGSWQTWFVIGREHRLLGHAEVAIRSYRRALEFGGEEADVLAELGGLLFEMGRLEEALPHLERATKVCPVDAGMCLQLGLAYAARNELIAAHRLLADAKHLDPSDRRIDLALQDLALQKRGERRRRLRAA